MEGERMPNLAPVIPKRNLKNNWFRVVPNPDDSNDNNLCIQIIEGPFANVILKYKNFQTYRKLNEDGSLNCDYEYDFMMVPGDIGERNITDEQGEVFEKKIGEAIIELLWESAENENRNGDTEELTTE
jgi:hypothetical protein